jgi:hypothetical protein
VLISDVSMVLVNKNAPTFEISNNYSYSHFHSPVEVTWFFMEELR